MTNNGYLPAGDNELVAWFDNFSSKFALYATTLGFVAADATATRNDYIWLAFSVLQVDLFKTETSERVAYKNLLRDGPIGEPQTPYPSIGTISFPVPPVVAPGIIPRLRATVQRIKAHPAYTEAAGQDLGIIGPAPVPPTPTKPAVAAFAAPNCCVKVTFKKSIFDGVIVESQRNGETTWTSLAVRLQSPFMDERGPLVVNTPETRKYRLRYLDGDEPTGDYSDIVSVSTVV